MSKLKYDPEERVLFGARALQAFTVIVLLVGLLIARFAWLQFFAHDTFAAKSDSNRVKLIPIAPQRGLIFDRHGALLAENRSAFRLEIYPDEVKNFKQRKAELWQILSTLTYLDDEALEDFERELAQRRRFHPVAIKLRLSEEDVARISVSLDQLPGVRITPYLTRFYPQGSAMAHIVGYVGRLDEKDLARVDESNYLGTTHIGKTGIESRYENWLHGSAGFEQVEVNAAGRVVRVLKRNPPVSGKDLILTVDLQLQKAVIAAYGEQIGAAVAIDPKTGEVLAMASMPSFDPNVFVNGINRANYKTLMEDRLRPTFDRALSGAYPPGSTIKPFMGIIGLENGYRTASSTVLSTGVFHLPGVRQGFRDWRAGGHGVINLHEAIAQSVNTYFYQLAFDMGIDNMHRYLSDFGFGQPTGIDLHGESSGLIPNKEWKRRVRKQDWYLGETVVCGIGQGQVSTTPMQLAFASATLADHGIQRTPHLLLASVDQQQQRTPNTDITVKASFLRDLNHWLTVRDGMIAVIHGPTGTARGAGRGMNYQIAGKTGTAQQVGANAPRDASGKIDARFKNQALFVGFAPAEAPALAVGLIVEQGGSGAHAAAPIGRAIFDAYLKPTTALATPSASTPLATTATTVIEAVNEGDEQITDPIEVDLPPGSEMGAPQSTPTNAPEQLPSSSPNANTTRPRQ